MRDEKSWLKNLRDSWLNVQFSLILDYKFIDKKHTNGKNLDESGKIAEEVRRISKKDYPRLYFSKREVISGREAFLWCKTNHNYFKKLFGENIKRGLSANALPILIPYELHASWYSTGDLYVPEKLEGLVKGLSLPSGAGGSFIEYDIWVPRFGRKGKSEKLKKISREEINFDF